MSTTPDTASGPVTSYAKAPTRTITVLDPTAEPRPTVAQLAPRLTTLKGMRLGVVDNSKPNADRILERIEERLSQQYELSSVRWWRKHNATVGALFLDELPGQVDLVVNALGD